MDILDILLDILLKPPQPLMGLFFIVMLIIVYHIFVGFSYTVEVVGTLDPILL